MPPRDTLSDRYAARETGAGLVIYDTDNDEAWLRSDAAVELDARA